ncbi:tumor protein p63-regulated gene 1 protein isoform X2 [Cynoglossus semilaevis]|uniref:tumor protein p63-regulated gene 1 protein isoform X2 n=2 Tax=Cynoglossus semilaevis TaxID=244447 RepID=UPI000D6238E1|nr:tumor protein p63-regulated gene 1-like protein isoform X2 [Cynoglossus semilaevis]
MSEAEEHTVSGEISGELEEQQLDTSTEEDCPPDDRSQFTDEQAAECGKARTESTEGRAAADAAAATVTSSPQQFKTKKFFVLRPGTLNQAIKDVEGLVDKEVDGAIQGFWLVAEVDHWNNEKERIVLITENSLLIVKYDFVMFNCDQIQRIPLNYVDRISHGTFSFPKHSLLQRSGDGVRVFWDRLREPSFISRWNPFATDFPFSTFTYHPVRNTSDTFESLCDVLFGDSFLTGWPGNWRIDSLNPGLGRTATGPQIPQITEQVS